MKNTLSKNTCSGGCLCGGVRYHVNGTFREAVNCHCGQCQRTHGNYAVYTATETDKLVLTEKRSLKWYQSSDRAQRGFCMECGASIFWQPLNEEYICVAAGTLDLPTGLQVAKNIFVSDAGDYYKIDNELENFPGSMHQ